MPTIDDLIAHLEDLRDTINSDLGSETAGGDAEVRLAIQPAWPMQHLLADHDPIYLVDEESGEVAAYLGEAGQCPAPYLPGDVSAALGWS